MLNIYSQPELYGADVLKPIFWYCYVPVVVISISMPVVRIYECCHICHMQFLCFMYMFCTGHSL
jgi:hypothetical protein